MVIVALALSMILAVAGCVLLAVAYPYRGRTLGSAPWLTAALGSAVRRATGRNALTD